MECDNKRVRRRVWVVVGFKSTLTPTRMLKNHSFVSSNSPLKMFNIPIENPAAMGKSFGRKGCVGFRMLCTIMINSKRLPAVMGNAEYLRILLHVLKKFHLSSTPISEMRAFFVCECLKLLMQLEMN